MIRIRYKDISGISAGAHQETWLHGRTLDGDRGVTVYLLRGLTTGQRRAVLRRLRQEGSRGLGPALPLPQLLLALAADRLRTSAGVAGAVIRLHPAEALLPSVLVAGLMALFVVVSAGGPGGVPGIRGQLAQAPTVDGPAAAWTLPVLVTRATARLSGEERSDKGWSGLFPGSQLPAFGPLSGLYGCPGATVPVWFAQLGQPVSQPCSSSRAAP